MELKDTSGFRAHRVESPGPGGGPGGLNPNELGNLPPGAERGDYEAYAALFRNENYAKTEPLMEILRNNPTPEAVVQIAEDVISEYEDENKDPDRFWLKNKVDYYKMRRIVMSWPEGKLVHLLKLADYVKDQDGNSILDEATKLPELVVKVPGLAVRTEEREVQTTSREKESWEFADDQGNVHSILREVPVLNSKDKMLTDHIWKKRESKQTITVPLPETIQDRFDEAYRCDRAEMMINIRQDLRDAYRFVYRPNTAALDKLSEGVYLNLRFTNRQIKEYWNVPDANLMLKDKENKVLGEYANLAKLLLDIVAASEKKEKMADLMSRPAWRNEVFKGFSDEEMARSIETWIGKLDGQTWKDEFGNNRNGWVEKSERHKGTLEDEFVNGVRGLLTEHGNIFARGDPNKEEVLHTRIKTFIAEHYKKQFGEYFSKERKIDQESINQMANTFAERAHLLAYQWYRLTGMSAKKGVEEFDKVKRGNELVDAPKMPHPEDFKYDSVKFAEAIEKFIGDKDLVRALANSFELAGDPDTDDWTKIYHFMLYRVKEFAKDQRASGPHITIAQTVQGLCVDLLNHARSDSGAGTMATYEEQNWGYAEEVGLGLPAVPSKKLGELEWDMKGDLIEREYSFEEMEKDFNKAREDWAKGATKEEKDLLAKEQLSIMGMNSDEYSAGNVWTWWSLWQFLTARNEPRPERTLYAVFYQKNFDTRTLTEPTVYEYKNKFFNIIVSKNVVCSTVYGNYRNLQRKVLTEDNALRTELRNTMAGNDELAKDKIIKKVNKAVDNRLTEQQTYQVQKLKALFRLAIEDSLIVRKRQGLESGVKGTGAFVPDQATINRMFALHGYFKMEDVYNQTLERGDVLPEGESRKRNNKFQEFRTSQLAALRRAA